MAFKIVVGYDGSEGARAALEEALSLASRLSGSVLATCVYGAPPDPFRVPLAVKELGQTLLSEALARSGDSGVPVEPVLLEESSVSRGLLGVARRRRAEMIVVGTRGHSPLRAMVLGSTTYTLLHITSKPLLVVPIVHAGGTAEMACRIVVGYDGSDGAKAALEEALSLAGKLSGKLLVTCAYGDPEAYSAAPLTLRHTLKEAGQTLLDEAVARSGDSGVPVEPVLVEESVVSQGLLGVARRRRAAMIVVGTRGQSPLRATVLGSTTYTLLHVTTKPLLVVPTAKQRRKRA